MADDILISVDAHVNEPHSLWFERLDADLRDRGPRCLQPEADGGWSLVVNGQSAGRFGEEDAKSIQIDAERTDAATIQARLEMMRADRVNGEVIYPTIGLYLWMLDSQDVGDASCRIYNDWIRERIGNDTDRVRLAGTVPTWSVDTAIVEAQRNAELGFAAQMLPLKGRPEWNDPRWEPLWDALEELGLPVVMHLGTGGDMYHYTGPGAAITSALTNQSLAARTVGLLTMSGVLERHPGLHFVLVETDAGWLPWTMNALDSFTRDHPHWVRPKLTEEPSSYIRRQVHAAFMNDPVAIFSHDYVGAECLLWGNDYPHEEGLFPHSRAVVAEMAKGLPEVTRQKIFAGNAAELFGFDLEKIADGVDLAATEPAT